MRRERWKRTPKWLLGSAALLVACLGGATVRAQALIQDGFESGSVSGSPWNNGDSGITVSTTIVHSGDYSTQMRFSICGTPRWTVPLDRQSGGNVHSDRTYYVVVTYLNSNGETQSSFESSVTVRAGELLRVGPSRPMVWETGWNVYVGSAAGTETKQNPLPLSLDAAWTEPPDGIDPAGSPIAVSSLSFTSTPGGSYYWRKYYVQYSYQTSSRETLSSPKPTRTDLDSGKLLVVSPPPAAPNAVGWNLYASDQRYGMKLQNTSGPIPFDKPWTEPSSCPAGHSCVPGKYGTGLVNDTKEPLWTSGCKGYSKDINHGLGVSRKKGEGLDHFFLRGYVYFKAPEPDGVARMQRKLFYLYASTWSVIFTTDWVDGAMRPRVSLQNTICQGGSNGGPCGSGWSYHLNDRPFIFNKWHYVELEMKNNTAPAYPWNGIIRVWIDDYPVKEWLDVDLNRITTDPFQTFIIGQQSNRYDYDPIHEYRYWDDVVISQSRIGPMFGDKTSPGRPKNLRIR